MGRERGGGAYVDLVAGPGVHGYGFDFGDVGAEFAVEGGASDAEEDS